MNRQTAPCECPTCGQVISFTGVRVDATSGVIIANGRFASLTEREFAVFEQLWNRPGRVHSKSALLDGIYQLLSDDDVQDKIIDVFICKLRKKLTGLGLTVETVRGHGYVLKRQHA